MNLLGSALLVPYHPEVNSQDNTVLRVSLIAALPIFAREVTLDFRQAELAGGLLQGGNGANRLGSASR